MYGRIEALIRRRDFRRAIERLQAGTAGPEDWNTFFNQFLLDCNVTKPRLAKTPEEIVFNEGKRHLAMSYLALLGEDDPQILIDRLQTQAAQVTQQNQPTEY